MKKFFCFFQEEWVLVVLMSTIIIFLNVFPDMRKLMQTPQNAVYQPIHNNHADFAIYINYIRQGLEGKSTLTDRFTTEAHGGRLVNPYYLVLGRIGRVCSITDPLFLYHTARVTMSVVWILVVYQYIHMTLSSKRARLSAFFFFLFSTSYPLIQKTPHGFSITSYMFWWTEMDPLVRTTFLPAHTTGHILLLLTIMAFTPQTKTTLRLFLFSLLGTVAGFIGGLFHTPSLILPLIILPVWSLITRKWQRFLFISIGLSLSSLSFVILSRQFTVFPWTIAWEYEQKAFAIPFVEYILGFGPIVPLALLGIFVGNAKANNKILWSLWTGFGLLVIPILSILQFVQIPFLQSLPLSNVRFLQIALIVPLSLLSGTSILWIHKTLGNIATGIVLIILTGNMIVTSFGSQAFTPLFKDPEFKYPSTSWMQAVQSLHRQHASGAVLSLPFTGLSIGMYTNRTVYIARYLATVDFERKLNLTWAFYTQKMPLCTAFSFLTENHITEVFYGFDEKRAGGDSIKYPFLTLSYSYADTQIFTVQNQRPQECR